MSRRRNRTTGRRPRGPGEGSIYQRKDGLWAAQVYDGERYYYRYRSTYEDALRALRDLQTDIARGRLEIGDKTTVNDLLHLWLEQSIRPVRRPRTVADYEQYSELYVSPGVGRYQVAKLRPEHVQQWINDLRKRGLSPLTIRHARGVLRQALNLAVRWRYIDQNPAELVDLPKIEKRRETIWTQEQVAAFLDHVHGHPLGLMFALAVQTGMRPGEYLGLTWAAMDLDAGTVDVYQQLQIIHGERRFEPIKTGSKGRRTIPLPAQLVDELRQHRREQNLMKLRTPGFNPHGLVFCTKNGTPYMERNVERAFKQQIAGYNEGRPASDQLPIIRLYDLRHTCASLLLASGVDVATVSKLLGHATVYVTASTYLHALPGLNRQTADVMERLLSRRAGTI